MADDRPIDDAYDALAAVMNHPPSVEVLGQRTASELADAIHWAQSQRLAAYGIRANVPPMPAWLGGA